MGSDATNRTSVFIEIPRDRWVAANEHAFAIRDGYPVTAGHTLVITRRVVATWFDATRDEQRSVMDLVASVKADLDRTHAPAGYNVGFNAGEAAGQTVPHLHVHVIPRYLGDMDDPRGGVRHVLPARGNYKRVSFDWTRPPGPELRSTRIDPLTNGDPGRHLRSYLGPLFGRAEEAVLVSAFVQTSGLDVLEPTFQQMLERGARLRLVTGDYLHITQADALQRLLDLQTRAAAYAAAEGDERGMSGDFRLRVVRTDRIGRAFHPKAWIFRWGQPPGDGVAYVGSSNLSRSALEYGVEWNVRIERGLDPTAWDRVADAAEALWAAARPIDSEWLDDYRRRARRRAAPLPLGDAEDEAGPPPEPRDVQIDALAALHDARAAGEQRALVVLATGLGKTYLAAFDVRAFAEARGATPQVLFLAHRRELLTQAARTFRSVLPDARFAWCIGAASDLSGDVVFASVQKLSRPRLLETVAPDRFDYIVVDEVHHATADSYRRILARLTPRFLLGLTATPDRADEADVLGLFDDHLPFRADLALGISRDLLVPFAYQGLRDTVDYAPIPWRNSRFDPQALAAAVQTQARMQTLWSAWERLPGSRTLVFCATIDHALFVRDWLREQNVRVEAVHSRGDSFDRSDGLRLLESGELDALCTVDLFNEGIDCKPIDRVVMLRPTESPVVFLQQLGRGLRTADGKTRLQVIDFVGNHRVFLDRLRTLLSLGDAPGALRPFLEGKAPATLPPGCSLDIEFEAIELLTRLLPASSKNELVRVYRELRAARDIRPTPGELHRMGLNPASVRATRGGWFGFVAGEGDLSVAEQRAFDIGSAWLAHLERTAMTKCFKIVVLGVLIEAEALLKGMPLTELARRSHDYLARSPELMRDLQRVEALKNPRSPDPEDWLAYWNKNPVQAWTGSKSGRAARAWFAVEDDRFVSKLPTPVDALAVGALASMTTELVDWQLARYRKRRFAELAATESGAVAAFRMKVLQSSSGNPILHFGNRGDRGGLPTGETDVRLPDGSIWQFRFQKIACNVARPVGSNRNQLPDLLRRWFGPAAGRSGTDLKVELRRSPDGLWIEPLGATVLPFPTRDLVVGYPTLRAAAGQLEADLVLQGEHVEGVETVLPLRQRDTDVFAVRATGDSMDGGKRPIRDGDWVLLRWARARSLGGVVGRIALVAVGDPTSERQFLIKRVVGTERGVRLRSEGPGYEDLPTSSATQVIAVLVDVVRPEDLGPSPGAAVANGEIATSFGLPEEPAPTWSRVGGHLFFLLDQPGHLVAPDRVRVVGVDPRPGETAFVLTGSQNGWRYIGVARRTNSDNLWSMPDVDFETWRALGRGRSASRRLDAAWLLHAERHVADLLAARERWFGAGGRRCRVVGPSKKGGVRIDGGPHGFAERTVSLTDIAWALRARTEAERLGGLPDEALVNRGRYLDGTPKSSTRWIDTGWALVLTEVGGKAQ